MITQVQYYIHNEIPESIFKSPPYKYWKEVILPNNLITINSEAFSGSNTIEKIVFPSTIQYISNNAFLNCSSLSEIVMPQDSRNITVSANAFEGVDKQNCVVKVPEGMKELFEAEDVWKDFIIVEMGDELTSIINNEKEMTLYPNPVTDFIVVTGIRDFTYSIVNALGVVVMQGYAESEINTKNLSNGYYSILINKGIETYCLSFVK